MNNLKFIETVYKGKVMTSALCEELKIEESDLNQFLKEQQLERKSDVSNLRWQIHNIIELSVAESSDVDDLYQVCMQLLNTWQKKLPHVPINEEIARHLILLHFKSHTERRAFVELCEGEIGTYRLYMQNDVTLFARYLVKSMVCSGAFFKFQHNKSLFFDTATFIIENLFEIKGHKVISQELDKMNLLYSKKNSETGKQESNLNFGPAQSYRTIINKSESPYHKGFDAIFGWLLENNETEIHSKKIYQFFEYFSEEGRIAIEQRRKKNIEFKKKKEAKKNEKLQQDKLLNSHTDQVASNTDSIFELFDDEKENKPQFSGNPITPSAHKAQIVVEQPQQENDVALIELKERFNLADEEIQRLERELMLQQQRTKESETAAIIKLFKKLGNSEMNFLLSDLYRFSNDESDMSREIIKGQLMNLFSALSSDIGLVAFGNGHKIGNVFKVQRGELASTYQVLRQIQSTETELTVELIQYGWQLNGKIIVQPLVIEKVGVI